MAQVGTIIIDFSPMLAQLRAMNEALAAFIAAMEAAQVANTDDASGQRTGPTVNPSL